MREGGICERHVGGGVNRGSSYARSGAGYVAAFIGPVAVGMALNAFGGASNPAGWTAAFLVMAVGSAAAALVMRGAPPVPTSSPTLSTRRSAGAALSH